jgi:hypothetical protein
MSFSDFLEDELLDHLVSNQAYSVPATLYLAVSTVAIGDDDTGSSITEPGSGYARVEITSDLTNWLASADGEKVNDVDFTFPAADGGNWGNLIEWALLDAATNGNMLIHGALTNGPITVNDGDTFFIAAGNLTLTLD